jgi:hypothetical protein
MSSSGELLTFRDVLSQTGQELLTRGFTTTGNYFNEVANEVSALAQQRKTQAETAQALWQHLDVLGERALDGLSGTRRHLSSRWMYVAAQSRPLS